MISKLIEYIFGRGDLYPFETLILESVISRIDGDAGPRLKQQLEQINHVQRHNDGREVNLYRLINGKVAFDAKLLFANAPDEECIARVAINCNAVDRKQDELIAEVWMAGGRIFSLEFNMPPNNFFSGESIDCSQFEFRYMAVGNTLQFENDLQKTSI